MAFRSARNHRFAAVHAGAARLRALIVGLFGLLALSLCLAAEPPAAGIPPVARDASLEAAIAASLQQNPLVSSRRSEVSAARHDIEAARWQYAPTLSTQLQAASGRSSTYGSALRADQRLYTGGRIDADVNAAVARRDSAVLSVQESGLSVAMQVVGAWQTLQSAEGQSQAIAAYRAKLDHYDRKITRRIDNGVSPQSEQSLVGARLAQSDNDRAAARAAAQTAQATLQRLSGAPLANVKTGLLDEAPTMSALCIGGEPAREAALDRHPTIRRLAQDIESARHALESQRASTKPSVTLRVEQPIGHQPQGLSRSTRVSLLMEFSSDAALVGGSRADSSADRLIGLGNQAMAVRREIGQQIETECAEQANAAQRVASFQRSRALTGEVLASYERLFVAGRRGWLDVLNAAREDFESQQGAYAATAALQASHYRMALLSGDYALGLPNPQDEPPMQPFLAQLGNRIADAAKRLAPTTNAAAALPAATPVAVPQSVSARAYAAANTPAVQTATFAATPVIAAAPVPADTIVALAALPMPALPTAMLPSAAVTPLATVALAPVAIESVAVAAAEPSALSRVIAEATANADWAPAAWSLYEPSVAVAAAESATRLHVQTARRVAQVARRATVATPAVVLARATVAKPARPVHATPSVALPRVTISHRSAAAVRTVKLLPSMAAPLSGALVSCVPRRDCDPRHPVRVSFANERRDEGLRVARPVSRIAYLSQP